MPKGNSMIDQTKIMKQWDYWRGEIADGHVGSAPRDWFESVLDHYEEILDSIACLCVEGVEFMSRTELAESILEEIDNAKR